MNNFLRYSFLMLLALICGNMHAETIVFGDLNLENGVQYSDPFDGGDFTVTFAGGGNNGKYYTTGAGIRVYGDGTMTVAAKSGVITQIVITYDGTNKPTGDNVVNEGSYDVESGTWTGSSASVVFTRPSGSGHWRIKTVEATINNSGQIKTGTTVVFSGDYLTRFTAGKDGDETDLPTATVKADGADLEGATTKWSLAMGSNWRMGEEEPSIGNGKVYIPNGSSGDLTLTAKYDGNDTYEGSNKSYTLKVYKGYINIQDILEQFPVVGGDSWATKEAEWNKGYQASYWQVDMPEGGEPKAKDALVTYVNGAYTYIKDDYGTLLLYGSGLGYKQGDIISDDLGEGKIGAIYGTLKAYNGLLEMAVNKEDVEFAVKSSGNPVEPKTITLKELNQTNMNEYVRIENAEFVSVDANDKKKLTFKVGDETLSVHNQWNIDITTLEPGVVYTVEGMGCIYYKNAVLTNQLYLVSYAGIKPIATVELAEGYLTRFTTGKDGDEAQLPAVTVKGGDAVIEGATVTWSLKMSDNWAMGEEEPSIGNGKVYIPKHSYGDLVLTAKYAGDETYEGGSKSYTLNVYKGYMNIQDILEQFPEVGGDSWVTKEATWTKGYQASYWQVDMPEGGEPRGKEAVVTYANGSYTYIKDDFGALLLYGGNLGFKKGDIISGDLGNDNGFGGIYGTLKAYNGLLELVVAKKADAEFVVKSSGNAVEPKTITVDELNQSNMNQFLRIERAVYVGADKQNQKKLTFMVDKKEFLVFNQWSVSVTALEEGKEYTLEGMGSIEYKNGELSNRLNLISFAESVNAPRIKSFKLTINHDGNVFTESFPASEWQNIVIEGQTSYLNIKKIEVEVGIPMKYVGFIGTLYNAEDGWQHDDTAWYTDNLEKQNVGLWTLEPEGGIDLTPPEVDGAGGSKPLTYEFFIYAEDENGTPMHYNNDGKNYKVTFTPADDPIAISNVKADSRKSATYNLSGQPVSRTYRGVVIQNARKVLR